MKKSKLIPLFALSGAALMSLAACGGSEDRPFPSNSAVLGWTVDQMEEFVLGDYDALYREAAAITDGSKTRERYEAFAEAEYQLIYEDAIIIPWLQQNGYSATVSKTVPWQAGRASYGLTSDKFKNVVAITSAVTQEQRAKVTADYEAKKGTAPDPEVDADGFTSLANQYPNGAIVNGVYTVGAGTENEVEFTTKNSYKTTYATEIGEDCLNYLTNTWTYNSYHYCNMVDGLVENDKYGGLCGAIATGYKNEANLDGTETWTFKLRDDATWVKNSDGSYVADVVAEDFVAGIKYVLDARHNSGTASLVFGFLAGAKEYYDATAAWKEGDPEPSFDGVGVVANPDGTLSYTLKEVTPYFLSCLTYSPWLPVNQAFLTEKGTSFGKTEDDILVNGAFRITTHTDEAQINYTKNASYYDAEHVYLDTVERKFVPGTASPDTTRLWYETGVVDAFSARPADEVGYENYVLGPDNTGSLKNPYDPSCNSVSSFGGSTYIGYWNFNRATWQTNNSANNKTYFEKLATAKAILNKNFRKGFLYGIDVLKQLEYWDDTEPYNWLARAYTNRELCATAGMDYLDFVDAVYNDKNNLHGEDEVTLTGINQGSDPIFDIEKAKGFFATAKEELIESGFLEESDFPIKVDLIGDQSVEMHEYEKAEVKALQDECGEYVKIQFNIPNSDQQNKEWGRNRGNYDLSFWSGWGPDYADPNTYAATLCIDGDMVEYLGF